MSSIKTQYILTLTYVDGQTLKRLLGNMTDDDFNKFGVVGDGREKMRDIWDLLPHPNED